MPQKKDSVKNTLKTSVHLSLMPSVNFEFIREWAGGQRKDKVIPPSKKLSDKSTPEVKGRFVFLRHRIGNWIDSGYGYDWRIITVWLSSFENDYLNNIEKVVYYLPESFANPVREKNNVGEKFVTSTAAYGDFNISAEVYLKNNKLPITINRLINVHTSLGKSRKPLD